MGRRRPSCSSSAPSSTTATRATPRTGFLVEEPCRARIERRGVSLQTPSVKKQALRFRCGDGSGELQAFRSASPGQHIEELLMRVTIALGMAAGMAIVALAAPASAMPAGGLGRIAAAPGAGLVAKVEFRRRPDGTRLLSAPPLRRQGPLPLLLPRLRLSLLSGLRLSRRARRAQVLRPPASHARGPLSLDARMVSDPEGLTPANSLSPILRERRRQPVTAMAGASSRTSSTVSIP